MVPSPGTDSGRATGFSLLNALAELGYSLAGAYRPHMVVERVAAAITQLLKPDSFVIALDEGGARRIAFATHPAAANVHDPLIDLVFRDGSIVASRDVAQATELLGVKLVQAPASWMGAPILATGQPVGAVSLFADEPGRYAPSDLDILNAVVSQAGIGLVNARLLSLLSSGKREWEQTVDAISQAFCVLDATGTVHRANRAFSSLVRSSITEIAGRPWLELVPPEWADPVARALASESRESFEINAGHHRYTVSALPIGAGDESAVVLVFEDQTETHRLQDQLIQSEKMSAIGQLIAGVAHDLNNPLASVVGFADYLVERERNAPDQLLEPLRAIRQEAERAASIVRNLLGFARKHERQRRSQPIEPILSATLLLLRNQLMACQVDAALVADPDIPDVTVDANQIQQVFVNLINNAAQAIQSSGVGGQIVVHATRWLDGLAIAVQDDGPGVAEPIADKVFEPFFTTKPEGQGTGLGLSVCHGIIKEHGGRLTLMPSPGGGATFRVELPGGAAAPTPPVPPSDATGRLRILVVDDEPHILHYMKATLESWGHSVAIEADGAAALALASIQTFDVVISDLRMPGVGGRELFEALRQQDPATARRFVFSTGDTVRGDTLKFLETVGQPYLRKPFTLAELRAALGVTTAG